MSSGRKASVLLLLVVVVLSSCISAISLEEERKITAVEKLRGSSRGFRGGGGGGGSRPRTSGSGHRTHPGRRISPAVVGAAAGSATAKPNELNKNAAAIDHAQPIYVSWVAVMLGITILVFV